MKKVCLFVFEGEMLGQEGKVVESKLPGRSGVEM